MAQINDFFVEQNNDGVYDLVIENGQFKNVYAFDTALQMIILCERRADVSEQPLVQFRRGWIGNQIIRDDDFEIGSKLWEYEQEKLTQAVVNKAVGDVKQACQWLIDDKHLKSVSVEGTVQNIVQGRLQLKITYTTLDNLVESKYYTLWANTGVRSIAQSRKPKSFLLVDPSGARLALDQGGFLLIQ